MELKELRVTDFMPEKENKGTVTEAIQSAIDLCPPGGSVIIPKGLFMTGALYLKSNMRLVLEEGAVLKGSGRIEDFPVMSCPYEGFEQPCYASLLNTGGARYENITIEGKGEIDANGRAVFDEEFANDRTAKRGRALCLRNVDNLVIKGVTIRNSPAWCLHIVYCRDVLIEGITIHSKYDRDGKPYGMHNCDGIDVDSCHSVIIKDSVISSQDDCIAIKSGRDVIGRRVGIPSENIKITGCTFLSGFGVAVGSEMSGGVSGVRVSDCRFKDTFSIASIKAVRGRGGYIRDISFENCTLKNESHEYKDTKWFRGALYIDGFYGYDKFNMDEKEEISETTPVVENILFKDLNVETVAGNAIYMCGLPEQKFKDIRLINVKAHGLYGCKIHNIEGLVTENLEVTADEGDSYEA